MNFNKYKRLAKQYDLKTKSKSIDLNTFLKKLSLKKRKSLGRSKGLIVMKHRGGGAKRLFKKVFNWKNTIKNYAIIRDLKYDPNRSAFIALIQYKDGSFSNILASSENYINQVIYLSLDSLNYTINGDFLKLQYAPIGVPLYNLESFPGSGAVYCKSAGVYFTLLKKSLKYGKVRLPSGEEKLFDLNCTATVGVPSNMYKRFNKKYKAGTSRLLNKRPIVRGVAMNPIDHPHGGGAGKSTPGRPSVSPWGKLTKGYPTRKKYVYNKYIIKRRK